MGRPSRHAGGDGFLITIRRASLADIVHLPLIEQSAGQAFLGTTQAWVAEDDDLPVEAYPPLVESGDVQIADVDGICVGFVVTETTDPELHVHELAVRQDQQGKGIGRALMNAAASLARRRHCRALTLTTFRSIAFNAPFYERLGYEIQQTPSPRLARILASERARGFTDRCAMRLSLSPARP